MYDIDIGIPAPLKGKEAPTVIPVTVRYDAGVLSEDEVNRLHEFVRALQKQIGCGLAEWKLSLGLADGVCKMNFAISQFELRLIMEGLDSYRDSIEDASKKVSSESLRTKMAEIQRNIVTLQRKIEAARPAASAPVRAA